MKKLILFLVVVLFRIQVMLFAGEPVLAPQVTISLSTGEQVNFYRDSEGKKILYVPPTKLIINRGQNGSPQFRAFVCRKSPQSSSLQGELNGGVVDCIVKLVAVADFNELKKQLVAIYPEYKDYKLAYVPMLPGSASLTMSQTRGSVASSGCPVSSEPGALFSARFRLSDNDATYLLSELNSNKPDFTSGFDILYNAKARMNLPPTTIKITANKRRLYSYVESHFKAKGGFFFWGFSADIRKIREKLIDDTSLKIDINKQTTVFSDEQIMDLVDKYLEKFILTEMHKASLEIIRERANAGDAQGFGFFGWGKFGTNYARVNINQFEDRTVSFEQSWQGAQEYPIIAEAVFEGLDKSMVREIDLDKTYFTYIPFEIVPLRKDILQNRDFTAKYWVKITNQMGNEEFRTHDFNPTNLNNYTNFLQLYLSTSQMPASGGAKSENHSTITYDFSFEIKGLNGININQSNVPFRHSDWLYDCPKIHMSDLVDYQTFQVPMIEDIFRKYPNLKDIKLLLPSSGGNFRTSLRPGRGEVTHIFEKSKTAMLKELVVEVTYKVGDSFVIKSSKVEPVYYENVAEILEEHLPGLELGK